MLILEDRWGGDGMFIDRGEKRLNQEGKSMDKDERHREIKKFWDNRAKGYKGNWQATLGEKYLRQLEIRMVIKFIKRFKPRTVLDIGCGNGYSTKEYSKMFPKIHFTGIDYSEQMILYARETQLKNCHLFADILKPDSLPKNKFDLILTQRCLQNLCDYESQTMAIKNLLSTRKSHGLALFMECSKDGVK